MTDKSGTRFSRWIASSLNRKFIAGTTAGLITVSVVFLLLFISMYRGQLQQERNRAADQVNHLLQTSLEAAMLRRDLEMLRSILHQLGQQEDIDSVAIINREGKTRFSSRSALLGHRIPIDCEGCSFDPARSTERFSFFTRNEKGREVLRTVQPVRNRAPCKECHGASREHPVNGTLVVDYDASSIQRQASDTTLALMGSGAVVVFINLIGGWWFIRRYVLKPLGHLTRASRAIANGDLTARVQIEGSDELSRLGEHFNDMAEHLQQSLQQIRDKEAFLQSLVDANPDGIRVIDSEYRVLLVNRAYCDQLGIEPEQAVGSTCYHSSHQREAPCPPTLVSCPVEEIRRHGRPMKMIHRHQHSHDREMAVEIYAAPMPGYGPDANDQHRGLIIESIRDLEKTVQISHEQKLSEIGRLAAGVAHEIHNPLASVRLALDSALRSEADSGVETPARIRECMELVDQEVDRCIEVTERLLKMSMFAGSATQVVSVNQAIEETLSLLRWEAAGIGIDIHQQLSPEDPRILANESDLRIILLNLVQNAFHAMPSGGTLTLASERQQDRVEIRVEDDGIGIRNEELSHIFEPFFSSRADGVEGTGLGLSITQALVQRFDGRIDVDSRPGRGSRFTVSFKDPDRQMEETE
ncbi:MAG TPA: HAMP domain-containing protein [Sedimenticola sp.]|nr:HAMP domain-containing protein [Sedimenticola sp.]